MQIRNIDIELHDNEDLSNHIRREHDFFEAEILDWLRDNYPKHGTIVDVGANIGNHSLYFVEFLEYKALVAFEPIPENYLLLVKNLTGHRNIGLAQYAVGASKGTISMTRNWTNMGNSRVTDDGDYEAPCVTLDSFHLSDVTLLKIDVESYEPMVLDGAQDTLFRCKPRILIEDWNNEYPDLLKSYGYELEKPWPEHRTYLYRSRDTE